MTKTPLEDGKVFDKDGKKLRRGSKVVIVPHEGKHGLVPGRKGCFVIDMYSNETGEQLVVVKSPKKAYPQVTRPEYLERRKYKPTED